MRHRVVLRQCSDSDPIGLTMIPHEIVDVTDSRVVATLRNMRTVTDQDQDQQDQATRRCWAMPPGCVGNGFKIEVASGKAKAITQSHLLRVVVPLTVGRRAPPTSWDMYDVMVVYSRAVCAYLKHRPWSAGCSSRLSTLEPTRHSNSKCHYHPLHSSFSQPPLPNPTSITLRAICPALHDL